MRPYGAVFEEELDARGELVPTGVVFLTNRECPFRCVFCDLWRNTLDETVTAGAIATQIATRCSDCRQCVRSSCITPAAFSTLPRSLPPKTQASPIVSPGSIASLLSLIPVFSPGCTRNVPALSRSLDASA
jgi:hypothetical protein